MKRVLLASLICGISFGFSACSNGDYDADPNSNNSGVGNPLNPGGGSSASALTTGSWKATAYTLVSPSGTTDLFALVDDCEKDNITTFNTNNTITIDEGATKCSPTDPQTKNDQTWALNGNQLVITESGASTPWDVVTLDNTTLKIARTFTMSGASVTATQTYSRP